MKFKISLSVIFAAIIVITIVVQNSKERVASVGSYDITSTSFLDRYNDYLISSGASDNLITRRAILNNMINELLLFHYDDNEAILNNEEYKKELKWRKKQVALAYLKDQEIYAKIKVTEDELRREFDKANQKVAASHLFAKTKEEADKLYGLLQIGVGFEELAKQVFTDTALVNNGGYLGYFSWGDMDPSFEETLAKLNKGEISEPVQTAYGYSIIRLEDKIKKPIITETEFLKNKSNIEYELKVAKKSSYEEKYIEKIFDKSKLSYNESALENILYNLQNVSLKKIESKDKLKYADECARYESTIYSQKEIEKRISELPSYHLHRIKSLESLRYAIEGFIINDKLMEVVEEKDYHTSPKVKETLNKIKMNVFLEYKFNEILNNESVNDSIVFNYYKQNLDLYTEESKMNVREIILDKIADANEIKKKLEAGADFAQAARQYSKRKWSAGNNGIMGLSPLSKFGSLKYKLWNASVGELIGPVEIQGYYGIFEVIEKVEGKPYKFREIKDEVTNELKKSMQSKIINNYLKRIKIKIETKVDLEKLGDLEILYEKSVEDVSYSNL